MSGWTYRVERKVLADGEVQFGIVEAYGGNREMDAKSRTIEFVCAIGEDLEDLRLSLQRMIIALEKPVIGGQS